MPCWPRVHPISSPRFLISLFIKLNIEDYQGNQWNWNDTVKYFSNCDTCVSLLTIKSSTGSNNYHNSKVVMSISQSIQSLSSVRLFVTPWTAAYQASLTSLSPGVYSNSCPYSRWCHPTISSSVIPFSSRLQSFPALRSFQMSQFLGFSWWSRG